MIVVIFTCRKGRDNESGFCSPFQTCGIMCALEQSLYEPTLINGSAWFCRTLLQRILSFWTIVYIYRTSMRLKSQSSGASMS